MLNIEIIVGSMLGATEYVADELKAKLEQHNHQVHIHLNPKLEDMSFDKLWIVCSSTHGAGDLPDNIEPFAEQLKNTNLSDVKFAIVGLGDTSYDTFCEGSKQLLSLLQKQNAKLVHTPLYIDVLEHPLPEEAAVEWLEQWLVEKPELI
ncbi:FMN-binding protein MioC [Alteromonas sp. a30]|uniref:FMN-binding protein MioC n=1 Tax=Alteromonas sp. a30 TaxID=2730917 RepID=UPI0022802271|nr:FMN-binding protein MioC [Alteromonas sp. a30]MCY7295412.1 FMN-binding protein MioC [Alteromonas sp. a30]